MSREPYNRVANSLRRVQLQLDRREVTAASVHTIIDRMMDVQDQEVAMDFFNLAHNYGALNGGEVATLRTILHSWKNATNAERLTVIMVTAELAGQPMTGARHSILGLQARPNRLAKIGA